MDIVQSANLAQVWASETCTQWFAITDEVFDSLGPGMHGLLRVCAQFIKAAGTGMSSLMSCAVLVACLHEESPLRYLAPYLNAI